LSKYYLKNHVTFFKVKIIQCILKRHVTFIYLMPKRNPEDHVAISQFDCFRDIKILFESRDSL